MDQFIDINGTLYRKVDSSLDRDAGFGSVLRLMAFVNSKMLRIWVDEGVVLPDNLDGDHMKDIPDSVIENLMKLFYLCGDSLDAYREFRALANKPVTAAQQKMSYVHPNIDEEVGAVPVGGVPNPPPKRRKIPENVQVEIKPPDPKKPPTFGDIPAGMNTPTGVGIVGSPPSEV